MKVKRKCCVCESEMMTSNAAKTTCSDCCRQRLHRALKRLRKEIQNDLQA